MSGDNDLLLSYIALRRCIGALGLSIPILLVLVSGQDGLRQSISAYYDSPARDVFVAALSSIGVFLICYRGYDLTDRICSCLAGLAAIGVALFPVSGEGWIRDMHLIFAGTMFTLTAVMCMFQFRKGDPTPIEDRIYLVCGLIIAAAIAWIFLQENIHRVNIFWPETAAIEAFGVAWLVKGRALRARIRMP